MKRYDTDEEGVMRQSAQGMYVFYIHLQARDLKMAELVGALPHEKGCAVNVCAFCHLAESYWRHIAEHEFTPRECTCPRGQLLAMLKETTK